MTKYLHALAVACAPRASRASLLTLVGILIVGTPAIGALSVTEDFSTDPLATNRWTFGVGSNANSQFVYQNTAPAFAGDSAGSFGVHLDSSKPTARLDLPLGANLTDTVDFTLTAQFSFVVTSAPGDQFMQIAFGLVNHTLTGGDRTGSFADFASDDVFHTVEFSYFPNAGAFGGPTLTPTVFGAQKASGDAFSNTATIFGVGSNLGDNTTGVTSLPQSVNLQVTLAYTGATRLLTLQIAEIDPLTGALTPIFTEVPILDLLAPPAFGAGYDPAASFSVDSLAIMAYQDGFTTAGDPSLVGDLTVQKIALTSPVPEPATTALLLGASLIGVLRMRPRAR